MDKLLVATPAYDPRVCAKTYESVVQMDKCGMAVECLCHSGYGVEEARTMSAQHALDIGAAWLMFVDSDMVVPRDALACFLQDRVPVVFGYYARGSNPAETTVIEAGRSDYDARLTKDELHAERGSGKHLLEARGAGLGCALIRTDVFKRIAEPWFRYTWSRNGRKLSEDYHFCSQCRAAGIRLFVDTRVDCGHVKEKVL